MSGRIEIGNSGCLGSTAYIISVAMFYGFLYFRTVQVVLHLVIMTWIAVVNNISLSINKGYTQVFQDMVIDITVDDFTVKRLILQLFVEPAVIILQFGV